LYLVLSITILFLIGFKIFIAQNKEKHIRIIDFYQNFLIKNKGYVVIVFFLLQVFLVSIFLPIILLRHGLKDYYYLLIPVLFLLFSFSVLLLIRIFLSNRYIFKKISISWFIYNSLILIIIIINSIFTGLVFRDYPERMLRLDFSSQSLDATAIIKNVSFFIVALTVLNLSIIIFFILQFLHQKGRTTRNQDRNRGWIFQNNNPVSKNKIVSILKNIPWNYVLFILVFLIGIYARVWEFKTIPPGMSLDEASTSFDAYSVMTYGVDRYGVSFPIFFSGFGSGMNALYTYLSMPFIKWGGLNPISYRLPELLMCILTLLFVYIICKKIIDENFAIIAMFFLAISPWHIILSRWGLESNIFPSIFTLAFLFLVKTEIQNINIIISFAFFALCLYAYGIAYAAIPLFLLFCFPLLFIFKKTKLNKLILACITFGIIALPILLMIIVNSFHLRSLNIGVMTIPLIQTKQRYEVVSALFSSDFFSEIFVNLYSLFKLIINQTNNIFYSFVEPYGYFYKYSYPLAFFGFLLLIPKPKDNSKYMKSLLLIWVFVSIIVGALVPVNVNRINIIFIPIILCTAFFAYYICKFNKFIFSILLISLSVGFLLFNKDYHSENYQKKLSIFYSEGIISAIEEAEKYIDNPVCISTNNLEYPYIYLFVVEKPDPRNYSINELFSQNGVEAFTIKKYGRYSFGLENCRKSDRTIYILGKDEIFPGLLENYNARTYTNFKVYNPIFYE